MMYWNPDLIYPVSSSYDLVGDKPSHNAGILRHFTGDFYRIVIIFTRHAGDQAVVWITGQMLLSRFSPFSS
jgi:hypothetical protein